MSNECETLAEIVEAERHTPGDAAAMREALEKIRRELNVYCNGCTLLDRMTEDPPDYTCLRDSLLEIERIVAAALSAPARQCDVGTAEEQWSRFEKMCSANRLPDDPDYCSCKCKVDGGCVNDCALIWAQMPYEAKEGAGK